MAWHYRQVEPAQLAEPLHALRVELDRAMRDAPLELLDGNKVLEVRLRGVNKGIVCGRVLSDTPRNRSIIAIGDDRTDEDMFNALPPSSITIAVGIGATGAKYMVDDPGAARTLLRALLPSAPSRQQ
jgi:trehalose 6-phosphate synthase/phosphatase